LMSLFRRKLDNRYSLSIFGHEALLSNKSRHRDRQFTNLFGVRIVFRLMFRFRKLVTIMLRILLSSQSLSTRGYSRLRIGKRPALTLDPSEKLVGCPQLLDSRSFNFSKGSNEFGRCQDVNAAITAKIQ
jgi:hypothetical protein